MRDRLKKAIEFCNSRGLKNPELKAKELVQSLEMHPSKAINPKLRVLTQAFMATL